MSLPAAFLRAHRVRTRHEEQGRRVTRRVVVRMRRCQVVLRRYVVEHSHV